MEKNLRAALAGNPNCGKSTIFNALTGARQHVGNYPGVTVERKEGLARHNGSQIAVTDLPGTYSLTAWSPEELVARDVLFKERPDVVINVVDATNIERSLYLTVQLMEAGAPLVVALNMADVAAERGMAIDLDRLSALMGVPMVATVGHKGDGLDSLLATAVSVAEGRAATPSRPIDYGREIEEELAKITAALGGLHDAGSPLSSRPLRWVAAKLLENDDEVTAAFRNSTAQSDGVLAVVEKSRSHLRRVLGGEPEAAMADRRYGFISGACQEAIVQTAEARHITSDKIDAVVTSRVLGIPILLALMYVVFYAAFRLANGPGHWIGMALGRLSDLVSAALPAGPAGTLTLRSLAVDGIIGGVGSVIAFLPNVLVLFIAIAALEDSGYMARAAFVMDHLMHKLGLHGKSFIPMIIGFGCSVPAIMATRMVEDRRGRITTMMVVPLMSCGARFPVYALIIPAFFAPSLRAPVLWLVYVLGIVLAVVSAKLLRVTLLAGESHPLVMELPPYRMPTARGLAIHAWERSWQYVKKAGTVILAASILLWFVSNWPSPPTSPLTSAKSPSEARSAALASSLAGRMGHAMEPLLAPVGLDWRIGTALVGAAASKEVFIAQAAIAYGVGGSQDTSKSLREQLAANYSPLSAVCMLVFILVASPCLATCAVTRRESGSWKWAALQWAGLTLMGYFLALAVFQIGSTLRLGN